MQRPHSRRESDFAALRHGHILYLPQRSPAMRTIAGETEERTQPHPVHFGEPLFLRYP